MPCFTYKTSPEDRPEYTRSLCPLQRGQALAFRFRPAELEECFAMSSTIAQDWWRRWQQQGLLEPARPGRQIRSWQRWEPWLAWVIGQLVWEE